MLNFNDELNSIIELLDCTAKEISNISNISQSVISRYKNGERIPKANSTQFKSLVDGLYIIAHNKSINLTKKQIKDRLEKYLDVNDIDFEVFRNNLNILINGLSINVADLSKYLGYDSSYISKIRNGKRTPQNVNLFFNSVVKYIANNYQDSTDLIESIINTPINDDLSNVLNKWITNNTIIEEDPIDNFLTKLDSFNLDDYIKSIKFDKLIVPTSPINIPKHKVYYGLDGYKNSQLDLLKSIILLKSKEDVFFYSNMSITEASNDLSFKKKFMLCLAFMLKKGLHLNMIHDLDRPFRELMLGLEGWIPLYMTGQISPYYFKNNSNNIYSFMDSCGGNVVLHGSYITGNISSAKFLVSTKKEDVDYYKNNSRLLLKKANSLMDIYRRDKRIDFSNQLDNLSNISGIRKNIYTKLPNYVLDDDFLNNILDSNNVSSKNKELIINSINEEKTRVLKILTNDEMIDNIIKMDKEEFLDCDYSLSLSKFFIDLNIKYTYEDYLEHINLIKKFKKKYEKYNYRLFNNNVFKNINISIISKKVVIISKEMSPTIHFVINHPKLVDSIEKFELY